MRRIALPIEPGPIRKILTHLAANSIHVRLPHDSLYPTATTALRPRINPRPAVQTGGGSGWEKWLAGAGVRDLREAISHRGDR